MEYLILLLLFLYHRICRSCVPSPFACVCIWSKQVNKSWGNMNLVSGISVTEKKEKNVCCKVRMQTLVFFFLTIVPCSQVICIINCNARFAIYHSCLLWMTMAGDPNRCVGLWLLIFHLPLLNSGLSPDWSKPVAVVLGLITLSSIESCSIFQQTKEILFHSYIDSPWFIAISLMTVQT